MKPFFSKLAAIGLGVLHVGVPILTTLAPLVPGGGAIGSALSALLGGTNQGTFGKIGGVVGLVERVFTNVGASAGNGANKLAAALPLVKDIVMESEIVSGHQIADDAKFSEGCIKIISGIVDVLNSLHAGVAEPVAATAAATKAL